MYFDSDGTIIGGDASGSAAAIKYTRFSFEYSRRVGDAVGTEVRVGGLTNIYSASIDVEVNKQDYDLETILRADPVHSSRVGTDNRILVRKVFYKTPQAMWRFKKQPTSYFPFPYHCSAQKDVDRVFSR